MEVTLVETSFLLYKYKELGSWRDRIVPYWCIKKIDILLNKALVTFANGPEVSLLIEDKEIQMLRLRFKMYQAKLPKNNSKLPKKVGK